MATFRGYYLEKMANNTGYFFVLLKSVNLIIKSTYGDIRNAQNLCAIRYVLAVGQVGINDDVGLNTKQERINKYFTISLSYNYE